MGGRRSRTTKLEKARDAEILEQAHERLGHLYQISRILVGFDDVDSTVREVLAVVAQSIRLRSAIFILETDTAPRTILWQPAGRPASRLDAARAHAQAAYRYLVTSGVDLERGAPGAARGRRQERPVRARRNFIFLPLAVANRPIFGAVQFETSVRLEERDLVLINAVVNQLSIAVARHVTHEARQVATEARRRDAEERQVTAEAGQARASEQLDFIRAVTGSLGEGVIAVDLDGRVTLFNPAAGQILGYPEEDALGKPLQEIVQIQRMDGTPVMAEECSLTIVMRTGGSVRSEEQLFLPRGRPVIAVSHTAAALWRDGEISGAVLAFQDITNRKRAEEVTARLAAIVTSSDDAIFSHDPRGVIQTWNDGATHLFGYSAEEVIGRPVTLLVPPDLADDEPQLRRRIGDGETVERYETVRQRKDGRRIAVSLTGSPIRDAAGRVIGASKIARDITYRRQVEEAQKRAEMEQRLLADVATIVASSLDRRATLSAVARCVVPLLADLCLIDEVRKDGLCERREVVFADDDKQRDLADRVRGFSPRPGWTTPQARVLASGRPLLFHEISEHVAQGVAQDKTHAEVMRAAGVRSMIVLPLRARGRKLGVLTLVVGDSGRRYSRRDLALAEEVARRVAAGLENAGLYEQAQAAIRDRENLLAIVSHDLKNPLGSILLTISLMRENVEHGAQGSRSRKHLELMERGARRMNRLLEDLLDMASIEGGHLSIARQRLDARPVVFEALEAVSQLAATRSLHLRSELPPDLPMLWADHARVQQVFANLLANAIKFTPTNGTITVRAEPSGDSVLFSVHDTGCGIAENDLPHLFERLWQAGDKALQGTGLGLFIVKGIVEAHGSKVWVESTVGQGTTFFFTLPAALPSLTSSPEEHAAG